MYLSSLVALPTAGKKFESLYMKDKAETWEKNPQLLEVIEIYRFLLPVEIYNYFVKKCIFKHILIQLFFLKLSL